MNNYCIVYCIDSTYNFKYYLNILIKSIKSFLLHNNYEIYIIHTSNFLQKKILEELNVNFIELDKIYSKIIEKYNGAFLKPIIPLIKKLQSYDKILYIDADIKFLNNIDEIFKLNFSNEEDIIGFREDNDEIINRYDYILKLSRILKLYNIEYNINNYINSGVLLFNIPLIVRYIQIYFTKFLGMFKWIDILEYDNRILEQTALNLSFNIKSIKLYKYNYTYLRYRRNLPDKKDIVMLHYIGKTKKYF